MLAPWNLQPTLNGYTCSLVIFHTQHKDSESSAKNRGMVDIWVIRMSYLNFSFFLILYIDMHAKLDDQIG
jgi:hypothetical protein